MGKKVSGTYINHTCGGNSNTGGKYLLREKHELQTNLLTVCDKKKNYTMHTVCPFIKICSLTN